MDTIFGRIWHDMTPEQKATFARRMNSTKNALRHVAHGRRKMSAARAIIAAQVLQSMDFNGVRRSWIRPDIFGEES